MVTAPQQFFYTAFVACSVASICDSLFLMRLPIIREMASLAATGAVGWHSGPHYPYVSTFGMLILGGAPYEGSDLEKKIAKRCGMVVSMLRPFESEGRHLQLFGHARPTQMAFWTTHGVSYQHIPMQDLSVEVDDHEALETLRAMNNCIKRGKSVYLHCQAGQGRSFIMCMAYLLIYGYPKKADNHRPIKDYDEALRIVKIQRPQVNATSQRRQKVEEIVAVFHAQQNQLETRAARLVA